MKYERLTNRGITMGGGSVVFYNPTEIADRLAELEDKIESGLLVELPCKVGDTVYEIFKDHKPPIIQETTIDKIIVTKKGLRVKLARNSLYETSVSSFGKTIFLTKDEAEEKLKEISNFKEAKYVLER